MADVNRGNRPLSPHLQVYRLPLTAIASILTRITGNALILGALLIAWWLFAAAAGPDHYAVANAVVTSWIGRLVLLGSIWALWFHALAGLRHLWFDTGRGLDLASAERLAIAAMAGSVVLTLLTVILI